MIKKITALCVLLSFVFIYWCWSKQDNLDLKCVDGENCNQEVEIKTEYGGKINNNDFSSEVTDVPPVAEYNDDNWESGVSWGWRDSAASEM